MDIKSVVEYDGVLYGTWWDLYYALKEAGKLPPEIDANSGWALEKYVILTVLGLDAKERPVK